MYEGLPHVWGLYEQRGISMFCNCGAYCCCTMPFILLYGWGMAHLKPGDKCPLCFPGPPCNAPSPLQTTNLLLQAGEEALKTSPANIADLAPLRCGSIHTQTPLGRSWGWGPKPLLQYGSHGHHPQRHTCYALCIGLGPPHLRYLYRMLCPCQPCGHWHLGPDK
jgi:hypothetical protein